ncbi:MAG: hypothetical protein R3270_06185 [Gammaproteobacteria bacterium]|nr:hypothetical protein [Gammaproteobacteria bacterium]
MIRKADLFILLAVAISFVVSGYLWFGGDKDAGLFTAIWVPAILGFGCYFKLVLVLGHLRRNSGKGGA